MSRTKERDLTRRWGRRKEKWVCETGEKTQKPCIGDIGDKIQKCRGSCLSPFPFVLLKVLRGSLLKDKAKIKI